MYLVGQRTQRKSRVHAALARYGVVVDASDRFGKKGREELAKGMHYLPERTRFATELQLEEIDELDKKADSLEERMRGVFEETDEVRRLRTIARVCHDPSGYRGMIATCHRNKTMPR